MSDNDENIDVNQDVENGHIPDNDIPDDDISSDEEMVVSNDGQFNTELPTAHKYLGKLTNTSEDTVYDIGEVVEILAIHTNTLVYPGYILPLVMNDLYEHNVMSRYIQKSNSIALIAANETYTKYFAYGVVLEIFESEVKSNILNLKARGRRRFKLVPGKDVKNLAGRLQMVTVQLLPETPLTSPLVNTQMLALKSKRPYTASEYEDFLNCQKYRRYHLSQYPFPAFVYNDHEICYYVKLLLEGLSNYIRDYLPTDPIQLSYWFPQNYQLTHGERLQLLKLDSTLERLKLSVRLLKLNRKICCENCGVELSDPHKVFAMSKDGIQSNYVNPGGHVFETVTVSEAKNYKLSGRPSKQFSWFPGYAWTIMSCINCHIHLGWKFSSANLVPRTFFGLANTGFRVQIKNPEVPEIGASGDLESVVVGSNNPPRAPNPPQNP